MKKTEPMPPDELVNILFRIMAGESTSLRLIPEADCTKVFRLINGVWIEEMRLPLALGQKVVAELWTRPTSADMSLTLNPSK